MGSEPVAAPITHPGAIPWRRALLVWMLIVLAETVHGVAREIFLAPVLGDLRARQLGVPVGCLIILSIALLTAGWLGARTRAAQMRTGAFWVVMTVLFEIVLGRVMGFSWPRILSDYNPLAGGFMLFGLAFMLVAPWMAARLRNRISRRTA